MNKNQARHRDDQVITQQPALINQMLTELSIQSTITEKTTETVATPPVALGPQLIAGDWIAWQCALSGSYWDMNQTDAPAYAEAHE